LNDISCIKQIVYIERGERQPSLISSNESDYDHGDYDHDHDDCDHYLHGCDQNV